MRKTIHTTLIILLFFGIAWAAPKYKIDSGSDMGIPPAIGATVPNTGNFTSTTHTSLYSTNLNARTVYTEKGVAENGDLYGFIGSGQTSLVKSGPSGYVLKSRGIGTMPAWQAESGGGGSPDWTNPGTIGSVTPNTIKGTTIESTSGLTIDAGGIMSTDTVAAGGSGIAGYADPGTAISSGDRLGYYFLGGAKDNAHSMDNAAGMSAYATQNWSGSAAGTKLQFEVTPNGSTTRSTAVTIDQDSTATFVTSKHTSEYAASFNARTVYTEKGVAENGDLYGFIGSGQTSLVKSGASGLVLKSNGVGNMPIWDSLPTVFKSGQGSVSDVAAQGNSTSVAVTGVGFTPKQIIIWQQKYDTTSFSVGFDNGSTSLSYMTDPSGNAHWLRSGSYQQLYYSTSSNYTQLKVTSWDSDGFTFTFTKVGSPTGTLDFAYLAFK